MTRAQIRTLLRRRVQEVTADQWSDANLNELINLAYQRTELDILSVNPQAFMTTYRADIVSGQAFYEKPAGFNYEIAFKRLDSANSRYVRMECIDYVKGIARQNGESEVQYSHYGTHLMLSPTPSASLASGLELDFVPSLSMTDDAESPKIVHPLHMALVYHAQIIALGETGEEQKRAGEELELLVNKIPTYYLISGQPAVFAPEVDKRY